MAVIRAVIDVIGAVKPGEQLQEKARLIRRSAAGVEEVALGRIGAKLFGDTTQRSIPVDDAIVRVAGAGEERRCEPAAPFQLARRQRLQLSDGIPIEEVGT